MSESRLALEKPEAPQGRTRSRRGVGNSASVEYMKYLKGSYCLWLTEIKKILENLRFAR